MKSPNSRTSDEQIPAEPTPQLMADGRYQMQLPRAIAKTKFGVPRKSVKSANEADCRRKWREACGIGPINVRPGSISEFMVAHGDPYLKSRTDNPDTYERYASAWNLRVGPHFGAYTFNELTFEIIRDGLMTGNSTSIRRQNKIVLNHLVRLAIALKLCDPSVLTLITMVKLGRKARKERINMAHKAEQLFLAARSCGSWMEGPIFTMMTIGVRKGELCGMKPTDIDQNEVLTLQRQRNHTQGERPGLKGGKKSRRIGLPPAIATAIKSYYREGSAYLFTKPDNTPIPYQHLDDEIKNIIEAVPGTEYMTIHDFRAAAICKLIAEGASDQQIIDVVGHATQAEIATYRDEVVERSCNTLSTVVPAWLDHRVPV